MIHFVHSPALDDLLPRSGDCELRQHDHQQSDALRIFRCCRVLATWCRLNLSTQFPSLVSATWETPMPRLRYIAALAVMAVLASPYERPVDAQANLPVAAYGFEEGSGLQVVDASGNGHAGTIAGATWTTSGRFGGALAFDGIDDWVS